MSLQDTQGMWGHVLVSSPPLSKKFQMNLIIVVVGVGVSLLTIKQTVSTGHNYADFLNFTQGVDLGGIKKCLNGL